MELHRETRALWIKLHCLNPSASSDSVFGNAWMQVSVQPTDIGIYTAG